MVSVYFGAGGRPDDTAGHDWGIGLAPSPLGLQVHHNLGLLSGGREPLSAAAQTFLVASLGLWAADKISPRQAAPDAWTRRLRLSLPAPGWEEILPKIQELAGFLTGDIWELTARPTPALLSLPPPGPGSWRPECICLFSGGVDSLCGALALLEAGRRVLLVSHYDFGQLAACQNLLTEGLTRHYGAERVRRWGFRIQFEAPELSLRSRSLLFLALGLAAAGVWGENLPVFVPENGWISLNPPLSAHRVGSYSTRTTHPYFIAGLQEILAAAGIAAGLINPYQFLTKGEMLSQSPQPALLRSLLPHTLSCAHPVASRWRQHRQGNCGYCFPCLLRRAALHAVGWDDGREYLWDALTQPEILAGRARGADLRSLLTLVHRWRGHPRPQELLWQSGPIPGGAGTIAALAELVGRGIGELDRWWQDQGAAFLREYAG